MTGYCLLKLAPSDSNMAQAPPNARERAACGNNCAGGFKTIFESLREGNARQASGSKTFKELTKVCSNNSKTRVYLKKTGQDIKPSYDFSYAEDSINGIQEPEIYTKYEAVSQVFCNLMAMDSGEFLQLISYLDIKPGEFIDASRADVNAQRIAELLGLNKDRQQVLARILTTVCEIADECMPGIKAAHAGIIAAYTGIENDGGIPVQGAGYMAEAGESRYSMHEKSINGKEVVYRKERFIGIEEDMIFKAKIKLIDLLNKVQANPGEEIPKITDNVIAGFLEKSLEDIEVGHETGGAGETSLLNKVSYKVSSRNEETGGNEKAGEGFPDLVEKKPEPSVKVELYMPDEEELLIQNSIVNPQNTADSNVTKTREPVMEMVDFIAESEIIEQVISKARVVLSDSKAEMLLDLKPENLGRLSLKVATENGIVTARFIAESEEVKHVLEANMQLLKDALGEQGFSIHELNVYVNRDLSRGFNFNEGGAFTGSPKPRIIQNVSSPDERIYGDWVLDNHLIANFYGISQSSIDLMV